MNTSHKTPLVWRGIATLFAALICVTIPLLTVGCATTAGGIAQAVGEETAGDVYVNAKLAGIDRSQSGTVAQQQAVSDITQLGTDLNAFAAGTLTNFELGKITQQLDKDGLAFSSNTQALTQINSILNIFAHAVTSVNGLVLPAQAHIQASIANLTAGFKVSMETYEGQWSVTNPGVWTAPPQAKR